MGNRKKQLTQKEADKIFQRLKKKRSPPRNLKNMSTTHCLRITIICFSSRRVGRDSAIAPLVEVISILKRKRCEP